MAILRPNKPPLNAPVDDFVWKKWFQDLYDVSKAGVASPSPLNYPTNGLQAQYMPKNILYNGDFSVWQRGTTFTVPSTWCYVADRWTAARGGVTGMTASRVTGPSGIPFAIRGQRNAGDTNAADITFIQSLPTADSLWFVGQSVTCSFWLRAGANYSGDRFELRCLTGTGTDENRIAAAYTGNVLQFTGTVKPVPTTWTRFQFTFNIPTGVNEFCLIFSERGVPVTAAGANDWFDLAAVQLEAGPGSPFELTSFDRQLFRCQRFFQKSFPYATTPAQNAGNAGVIQYTTKVAAAQPTVVMVYPNQVMRITPVLTFFNPGAANAKWRNLSAAADSGVAAASGAGDTQFAISNPQVATDAANQLMAVHYTADADL